MLYNKDCPSAERTSFKYLYFLQQCLVDGDLNTAASYLIILQNLEKYYISRQVESITLCLYSSRFIMFLPNSIPSLAGYFTTGSCVREEVLGFG